jgi:hypothetical protein
VDGEVDVLENVQVAEVLVHILEDDDRLAECGLLIRGHLLSYREVIRAR